MHVCSRPSPNRIHAARLAVNTLRLEVSKYVRTVGTDAWLGRPKCTQLPAATHIVSRSFKSLAKTLWGGGGCYCCNGRGEHCARQLEGSWKVRTLTLTTHCTLDRVTRPAYPPCSCPLHFTHNIAHCSTGSLSGTMQAIQRVPATVKHRPTSFAR